MDNSVFLTPMRKTYSDWKKIGRNVRKGEHGRYCHIEDDIVFDYEQTRVIKPWSERKPKPIDFDTLPDINDHITLALLFAKRGVIVDPLTPEEGILRVYKSWLNIGRVPKPKLSGLKVKRIKKAVSIDGTIANVWERISIWHKDETITKEQYIKRYRKEPK
jgi:hypothetical protein